MEIRLAEEIQELKLDQKYLSSRASAKILFEERISERLLRCRDAVRKVILNCDGISSGSSSFIDELMFIDIFIMNYRHGNSVLVLTNLSEEFYFNVCLAVEGKKNLIENAKKNGKYSLVPDQQGEQSVNAASDDPLSQVGSPYLLCEHGGKVEVLGFAEGEKQKHLLEQIVQGRRITAAELAKQESISKTAANNRLNRLYERRLVFRELKTDGSFEKYEYFFQ